MPLSITMISTSASNGGWNEHGRRIAGRVDLARERDGDRIRRAVGGCRAVGPAGPEPVAAGDSGLRVEDLKPVVTPAGRAADLGWRIDGDVEIAAIETAVIEDAAILPAVVLVPDIVVLFLEQVPCEAVTRDAVAVRVDGDDVEVRGLAPRCAIVLERGPNADEPGLLDHGQDKFPADRTATDIEDGGA